VLHVDSHIKRKIPWPKSVIELYRTGDSRLSEKLVTTFGDRGCYVVSVTDPYDRILGFLDRASHINPVKINLL
jgi:hypothetical protein